MNYSTASRLLSYACMATVAAFVTFGTAKIHAQEVTIVDDHSTPASIDPEAHSEHHVPIENDRVRPKNLQYQLMSLEEHKRSQRHPVLSMVAGSGFFLIGLPMLVHGLANDESGLAVASIVPLGLSAVFFVVGGLFYRRNRKHNNRLEEERQRLLHPNVSLSPSGFILRF